jgi:hypothetical protein
MICAAAAALGLCALAWPAQATAGDNLLTGKPRIGTVRAMVPERGRDAGRLVVWVRVNHAAGSQRAVRRERPETVHAARVVARVNGVSRVATRHPDLEGGRTAGGYFLRFPKPDAGRARISLRVAQALDLDADGDDEDRAVAATARSVALATPATTIEPADGRYRNLDSPNDFLQVTNAEIVHFSFLSATDSSCGVGPADDVQVPIDPQTGRFTFATTVPGLDPPVTAVVQGRFRDAKSSVVDAAISREDCTFHLLGDFDLAPEPSA